MKMKKGICVLLIAAMLFSLTGCCLKHDWEEATCTDPKTCLKCGKTDGEPLGHDYSDWIVADEPSYLSAGMKKKECSRCGDTITQELPKLDTDHCLIVDGKGMTVTYEECYFLLEEVLSGRTSYLDLDYSFSFQKGDNENIRFLKCNNLDTNVMVTLCKHGDKPGQDEKIDYIMVSIMGKASAVKEKLVFLKACAAAAIAITREDIDNGDDALKYFASLSKDGQLGKWDSQGILEYMCDVTAVGSGNYLVMFAVRVEDQY